MYETDVYKVAAYLMVAGSERWKGQIQIWTGQLFVSSVKKSKECSIHCCMYMHVCLRFAQFMKVSAFTFVRLAMI